MPVKPLLSATLDPLVDPACLNKLKFPYLASPKLDGIRAIAWDGILQSRSGKAIPSMQAQGMFKHLHGLDGELIIGKPTDTNVYNTTQSHVMSYTKPGDLHFHVFDRIEAGKFYERLESLPKGDDWLHPVEHKLITTLDELLLFESEVLSQGFEGIMLRDPNGRYKHNRSTLNDNILLKLKRFAENDLMVVGFKEQMINLNEAKINSLGYTERSISKDGLAPANTLGKLVVVYNDEELDISCGSLTHDERRYIWFNQDKFVNRVAVVRHFTTGLEGYRPRFPRFSGWRDDGR